MAQWPRKVYSWLYATTILMTLVNVSTYFVFITIQFLALLLVMAKGAGIVVLVVCAVVGVVSVLFAMIYAIKVLARRVGRRLALHDYLMEEVRDKGSASYHSGLVNTRLVSLRATFRWRLAYGLGALILTSLIGCVFYIRLPGRILLLPFYASLTIILLFVLGSWICYAIQRRDLLSLTHQSSVPNVSVSRRRSHEV